MASHGFVPEAPSLVSIYFACVFYLFLRKVTFCHLLTCSSPMFTPLYFCSLRVCAVFDHFGYPAPPIGDWRHVKWYNLRLVQQTLEEMQQRVTSGLTPLPPLPLASSFGAPTGTTASPGPEVAQKAPRSKVGKAQLAAASQKRGRGGGSKGIHLEDSSTSGGVKQRKRSNQPDSSNNCRPQYEDTFEDSDDSTESFEGPFPGPPSSAMASSTTGTTSQTSKLQAWGVPFCSPQPQYMSRHFIKLHHESFL